MSINTAIRKIIEPRMPEKIMLSYVLSIIELGLLPYFRLFRRIYVFPYRCEVRWLRFNNFTWRIMCLSLITCINIRQNLCA